VGVSSAAPAALFTVIRRSRAFEGWRLQPVNLRSTNSDITTMPCLTVLWIHSFCYSGSYWCSLLINRWRYCRISNRCNILIKGTTFLELASTCFMLSSLQDVNASKKIKRKENDFMAVYLCLLVIKYKPLKIFLQNKN
jgi:hypothetical protein